MASKTIATTALLLSLNLLFFTMVSSTSVPTSPCPDLSVCANLLDDLLHLVVGPPTDYPCCSLIGDLVDLDSAVCLCTAIKADILGINLNVPVDLSLILNFCGKQVPTGFQCA